MEISAGDALFGLLEDNRIVRHRIHFNFHFGFHIGNGILTGAMYLGNAAQGVAILHADLPLSGDIAAALQQVPENGCSFSLPIMRTDLVHPGVQRVQHAAIGFKAQRRCNIRHL